MHFWNVYCTIVKEMSGPEIFNLTKAAGPSLLKLGRETKWRRCFRNFVGAQEIEDLTESKNFFAEVFQITSRFVSAEKKILGLGAL